MPSILSDVEHKPNLLTPMNLMHTDLYTYIYIVVLHYIMARSISNHLIPWFPWNKPPKRPDSRDTVKIRWPLVCVAPKNKEKNSQLKP